MADMAAARQTIKGLAERSERFAWPNIVEHYDQRIAALAKD